MGEDLFQIIERTKSYERIVASDLTIDNAVAFVEFWFLRYYNDKDISLEIRRQHMENLDSIMAEHERIGYERGHSDGYADAIIDMAGKKNETN